MTQGIVNNLAFLVIPLLFVVNAGYGGGFSNVPTLLSKMLMSMATIYKTMVTYSTFWYPAGLI